MNGTRERNTNKDIERKGRQFDESLRQTGPPGTSSGEKRFDSYISIVETNTETYPEDIIIFMFILSVIYSTSTFILLLFFHFASNCFSLFHSLMSVSLENNNKKDYFINPPWVKLNFPEIKEGHVQ